MTTLATKIAGLIQAIRNCEANGNKEWLATHTKALHAISLPSGAGFDRGTIIDIHASTPSRLVFQTAFHHMNDVGYYDGWTEHTVTAVATFGTPEIKVSGSNSEFKDYIGHVFHDLLTTEVSS